ncbi:MAG: ActS/PrrB/RegB family redox-sensitive histidine kinase [Pseudomonadota bacterium]
MDTVNPHIMDQTPQRRVIRVRTLVHLRWFAIAGQLLVTLGVRLGLGYELPVGPILAVVAVVMWVNVYTLFNTNLTRPLGPWELVRHLCFDAVQIATILFLSGGIQNPFSVWLVLPAMLGAASLSPRKALIVGGVVVFVLTTIALVHFPLPFQETQGYDRPAIYDLGTWLALMLCVGFTSVYAYQVATEQSKLSSALQTTQKVLAREERLTALGGLAAAAAHELGTPLATIQVTAKEMGRDLPEGALKEDAKLLISQTQRCQSILRRLSNSGDNPDAHHSIMSLDDILREAAKPFLDQSTPVVEFVLDPSSEGPLPDHLCRMPEVIYSLRTLIENGVKYTATTVRLTARWSQDQVVVLVEDDGDGFQSEVLNRLGEPFPRHEGAKKSHKKQGLGLGFFIAKTLLHRTGATISFGNAKRLSGAWVEVSWPLANLRAESIYSSSNTKNATPEVTLV